MLLLVASFACSAQAQQLADPQPQPAAPQNGGAAAQAEGQPGAESDSELAQASEPGIVRLGHLNPPDRATLRLLTGAEELVRLGRYAEAVRCLGQILENEADYLFQPDRSSPAVQSLKARAEELLRNAGARGLELYELQFGVHAGQLLRQAVDQGDLAAAETVARSFFLSTAGQEATYLLGLHHLHTGRAELAAMHFDRLLTHGPLADRFEPALSLLLAASWNRAGRPDLARKVLLELNDRIDDRRLQAVRKAIPAFNLSGDPLEWLQAELPSYLRGRDAAGDGWLMFRGSATRNQSADGGAPLLSVRWRVPTTDQPYLEAMIRELDTSDRVQGHARLTALHPVASCGLVLMRTTRNLLAVDARTGKRIWEVPSDDPFEQMIRRGQGVPNQPLPQLGAALRVLLWDHATYGTLSSDGRQVYAIESLGSELVAMPYHPLVMDRQGGRTFGRSANQLAAYDIHTGKLQWQIGEMETGSESSAAADVYFLGPPLPLADRLYVLAQREGEVRLLVLQNATGELVWSQQLGRTDSAGSPAEEGRFDGLSPSYGDGLLVCPLPNRCIVAVDLVTRQLRWAYSYRTERPERMRDPFAIALVRGDVDSRWRDWGLVLAEGCVLATPGDSQFLHCLDLRTGALRWKEPRRDDLYLACVHQGKAVLVGPHRVRAVLLHQAQEPAEVAPPPEEPSSPLDCAPEESAVGAEPPAPTPAPAWGGQAVPFPPGSMTNGYGFLAGSSYWVPLRDGSILAVDLSDGKIREHWKSRSQRPLGNLVSVAGTVVSQTADGLTAFPQLQKLQDEVDQRLAADPSDPQALIDLGEILLQKGRLSEAVASFRKAAAGDPTPRSRQLLADAMLEALQAEFTVHRQWADQLEQLLEEPEQQARFLRLMATGSRESGDFSESMEYLLRIIELDTSSSGLEAIDGSLSIRRDRWIAGQLASLHEQASETVRQRLDQLASEQLRGALAGKDVDALRRLCRYFANLPVAAEANRQLVEHLEQAERWIELEHLLLSEVERGEATRRGDAVLALARLFRQTKRWADVAATARWINDHSGELAFSGMQSGAEAAAQLLADNEATGWAAPLDAWPAGAVQATEESPEHTALATLDRTTIPVSAGADPYWAGWQLEIGMNPPMLLARDAFGRTGWFISLKELARANQFALGRSLTSAVAMGHLLFVSNGERLLAIDTLAAPSNVPGHHGSARLLWSRSLRNLHGEDELADHAPAAPLREVWLASGVPVLPDELAAVPLPLGTEVLCVKQSHRCTALDPLSGEAVWIRSDLPPDGLLAGNAELLLCVSAERREVSVYRTSDGVRWGARPLPEGLLWNIDGTLVPDGPERSFHPASFGCNLLCWRLRGNQGRLVLVDVWNDRTVWQSPPLRPETMLKYVGQREVAAFEPGGRFRLFRLTMDKPIIDIPLSDDPALGEMLVIESPWQYLVLLYSSEPGGLMAPRTYHMHGAAAERIHRGKLYAFDRQGRPAWPRPVTVSHQWLPLNQPAAVPVITFACIVQQPQVLGQRQRAETAVLCLDRRTGRTVYNRRFDAPGTRLDVIGDPETRSVRLLLQQQTVKLRFTDEPVEEPGNVWGVDANTLPGMLLEALLEEARKAIGQLESP